MLNSRQRQTTHDLRKINRSKVLRTIYFHGPIERLEISKITGLSASTVTNVVTDLLGENIIEETGVKESEGGRPSVLLSINAYAGYILGIDFGETLIDLELFTPDLRRAARIHYSIPLNACLPEHIVDIIGQGIKEILDLAHVKASQVIGAGVGVPGLADPAVGSLIFIPTWDWHDVPLRRMLEECTGMTFHVDNGAKTMALAESLFGAGKQGGSTAVLLLGTGIGAGFVENGVLVRGAFNSAGEIGHTKIVADGQLCNCGKKGCLEAYASAPAIITRYLQANPAAPFDSRTIQMEAIVEILRRAEAGESAAQTVLGETARYLGIGIANLINLNNPELILIGGWAGAILGKWLLPGICETVEANALPHVYQKTQIDLCMLGSDAITFGAATLVVENLILNPIRAKK